MKNEEASQNGNISVTIRRMNTSDAAEVGDLIDRALRHKFLLKCMEQSDLTTWGDIYDRKSIEEIADRNHAYVIQDADTRKILASGYISLPEGSGTAHIGMVFTDPDYQNMGLGRMIMENLERDELAGRAADIWLHSSMSAYRFYRRMGYGCENGEYDITIGDCSGIYGIPMTKERNGPEFREDDNRESENL